MRNVSALLVAVATCLGCGSDNPLGRVPVLGTVTLDTSPLDFGSIAFTPTSGGATSSGAVIIDGKYSIPQEKGLPPGEYLVRINASTTASRSEDAADEAVPGPPAIERIAPAFNTRSKLTVRVVAGQDATFNFETTSATSAN